MANEGHLKIINQGVKVWNVWREENPLVRPDLSAANLSGRSLRLADLSGANLSRSNLGVAMLGEASLRGAELSYAELGGAYLTSADLSDATLHGTDLSNSFLIEADLRRADLFRVNLFGADLSLANLSDAGFRITNLSAANLRYANLSNAKIWGVIFGDNDLSTVKGLETVTHLGPSTIGVDSLFKSNGKIPEIFLRGAGFPEDFITFVPSLVGRAIEFYSCFISYSHQDEGLSQRLHARMRAANLRVWYAPEDMQGGRKLHEEIFRAIQIHDKLLLVLSENSMKSEWVTTEIRRARKVEQEEKRRKLFPIRLVDFEAIQKWECFDADTKKDLAVELREYYIPDFSNWKDHDAFEREFAKLLRDLRATEK